MQAPAPEKATNNRVWIVFSTSSYWSVARNWFKTAKTGDVEVTHYVYGRFYYLLSRFFSRTVLLGNRNPRISDLWRNRLERVLHHIELGQEVILCDLDAMPLENPWPHLDKVRGDVVSSQGTVFPKNVHEAWGYVLCCGFMLFRPTDQSKKFLRLALDYESDTFTDQLAINNVLLREDIDWSDVTNLYEVEAMGRRITCSHGEISGTVKTGELCGLSISILPHAKFRRLPNEIEKTTPIMFHPLPARPGAAKVRERLKQLGLWHSEKAEI